MRQRDNSTADLSQNQLLKWKKWEVRSQKSEIRNKQARKLQDAQAEKLTSLQAEKLTNWQADKLTSFQTDRWEENEKMKRLDDMEKW